MATAAARALADRAPGDIRVTADGKPSTYVSYGTRVLRSGLDSVTVRASGSALTRAVGVAEHLKRAVPGLHQITTVESPASPGGVPGITIVLSSKPLDASALGYQPPVDPATASALSEAAESVDKRLKTRMERASGPVGLEGVGATASKRPRPKRDSVISVPNDSGAGLFASLPLPLLAHELLPLVGLRSACALSQTCRALHALCVAARPMCPLWRSASLHATVRALRSFASSCPPARTLCITPPPSWSSQWSDAPASADLVAEAVLRVCSSLEELVIDAGVHCDAVFRVLSDWGSRLESIDVHLSPSSDPAALRCFGARRGSLLRSVAIRSAFSNREAAMGLAAGLAQAWHDSGLLPMRQLTFYPLSLAFLEPMVRMGVVLPDVRMLGKIPLDEHMALASAPAALLGGVRRAFPRAAIDFPPGIVLGDSMRDLSESLVLACDCCGTASSQRLRCASLTIECYCNGECSAGQCVSSAIESCQALRKVSLSSNSFEVVPRRVQASVSACEALSRLQGLQELELDVALSDRCLELIGNSPIRLRELSVGSLSNGAGLLCFPVCSQLLRSNAWIWDLALRCDRLAKLTLNNFSSTTRTLSSPNFVSAITALGARCDIFAHPSDEIQTAPEALAPVRFTSLYHSTQKLYIESPLLVALEDIRRERPDAELIVYQDH
eukprot:m51a1_g9450 hypothetical protein (672) ;mRNA; f:492389-495058